MLTKNPTFYRGTIGEIVTTTISINKYTISFSKNQYPSNIFSMSDVRSSSIM